MQSQINQNNPKSQHIIQHVIEFNKLLLLWQAPKDTSRLRYIVGEISKQNGEIILHYLKNSADFKKAESLGFDGYAAFKIDKEHHNVNVLDAFLRRIPPRTRGDFPEYLANLRLPVDVASTLSDFALLGYAGAKLPSDGFSIIPSFESVPKPFEFLMEVAGFRHLENNAESKLQDIAFGTPVTFAKEQDNKVDPHAICIQLQGKKIGYVPRGYLSAVHQWMEKGYQIKAVVERKNGEIIIPSLYLFVSVS